MHTPRSHFGSKACSLIEASGGHAAMEKAFAAYEAGRAQREIEFAAMDAARSASIGASLADASISSSEDEATLPNSGTLEDW